MFVYKGLFLHWAFLLCANFAYFVGHASRTYIEYRSRVR